MSMLTLHGQVINVFQTPENKNKTTGEIFGGDDRVQVMAESILQNGEKRMELVNLTVTNPKAYLSLQGRHVRVPVGVFARANAIHYFVPKDSVPEPDNQAKGGP